ncbi:MAG TPA: DUF2807 domain-containing protein [Allosphingosinicella sp.]|nr:DUF2807 domain-containing protein [Allosphingosinicella sp.]
MRFRAHWLLPLAALLPAASAPAAVQDGPAGFRSIELRGGGTVTVRYGATRTVTVRSGDPASRPIRDEGDRLVIDRCQPRCSHRQPFEVEIITPELAGLAVSDGGRIRVLGDFPAQPAVAASVSSGGMIDMRALEAGRLSAAVAHGGLIYARPRDTLAASISNGGLITYWGEAASVSSTVRHGGAVVRGKAADLRRPVEAFDPTLQTPHAPPAVPAVPALRTRVTP